VVGAPVLAQPLFPTPTPHPPQMGLFLNKSSFLPQDIFSLDLVLANTTHEQSILLSLALEVGHEEFYWPLWSPEPHYYPIAISPGTVALQHILLTTLPSYFPSMRGRFVAGMWEDLGNGQRGDLIASNVVPFEMWAPTPTPTPEFPCRRGYAIVRVRGIPQMTDETKDEYNKQLLFCIRDEENTNFVGVYHRYLQPSWPYGEWWPTWRIEAGADGCVEEFNTWDSMDLPGSEATFRVEWTDHSVTVTHLGTGESQTLHTRNTFGLSFVGEDDVCEAWGWPSFARATMVEIDCEQSGEPMECRY
jgi:hypothetical protein